VVSVEHIGDDGENGENGNGHQGVNPIES
jgi:hypothetical protein